MILVTGVPGWIGNRFIEMARSGEAERWYSGLGRERIRCLIVPGTANAFTESISKDVELVEGDITLPDTLGKFFAGSEDATLFHCAGVIHPKKRVREFYDVNVWGTHHLLTAARAHGLRKAVLLSSNSQSGTNPDIGHRFTEESPYNPYLNYGRSKMMMEMIGRAFVQSYAMDITIIRACWFYGPHQPPRQTRFFSLIKNGKFPLVAGGVCHRSLSYVDDLCQGMLLAASNPVSRGKTYWIASEKAYPMHEIVATVGRVMEEEFHLKVMSPHINVPGIVSDVAYCADCLIQAAGRYQQEVHVLSEMNKTIACSIDRARSELGYVPSVTLHEGMRRSIAWCIEQGYAI